MKNISYYVELSGQRGPTQACFRRYCVYFLNVVNKDSLDFKKIFKLCIFKPSPANAAEHLKWLFEHNIFQGANANQRSITLVVDVQCLKLSVRD